MSCLKIFDVRNLSAQEDVQRLDNALNMSRRKIVVKSSEESRNCNSNSTEVSAYKCSRRSIIANFVINCRYHNYVKITWICRTCLL
jgi:hypothetical protein